MFGTHPQPFERALDWILGELGDQELVIQHGSTPPRAQDSVRWYELVPYDELVEFARAAEAVVCHAGVGTLMTIVGLGRKPVAIPRLRAHGEHVDDHQLQIANELERGGYAVTCAERSALAPAVRSTRGESVSQLRPRGDLRRAAILAAGGDPDRRGG